MKAFLKRYKVFLILVILNVVVGAVFPEIGIKSFSLTKQNFVEMISVIPPIFILLGLLDVWVDRATMMKYTGKGSGLKGVLIALLMGSAAAGPLYAAFPIAGIMLKKGSSLFNVFVFIGAWYNGYSSSDNIHPTAIGSKVIVLRYLIDVPEIMNV